MRLDQFTQHATEVGGQGQVAPLVELLLGKPWPVSEYFAAANVAAHDEHDVGMPVIGAAVAVLARRPAEFRHRDQHSIRHAIATAFLRPRMARGSIGPIATARTGEMLPCSGGSARFSQPSVVALYPRVPDSM